MAETKDIAERAPVAVRAFGAGDDHLWTTTNLGDLFQMGYVAAGSRSAMLRLAISLKCIDVLSRDVAKTPAYLYRRKNGGAEIVEPTDHPVAKMLAGRTSRYYGVKEFLRIATAHLVTASQYYVAARRKRNGELLEIQGIPHPDVTVRVEPKQRRYVYDVTANGQHAQAQYGWAAGGLLDDQMAHIRLRSMNGIDPIATSAVAKGAFDLISNMQKFQSDLFSNGGMPILALTFPDGLTDEQWQRLNKDLQAQAKKAREKGVPFILEGQGISGQSPKVEKMSLTAVDTEFLKANNAALTDVCRYYGVPPHKVYLFEGVKYDNVTPYERAYVTDSLVPIFDAITEALHPVLLTEAEQDEYFIMFDKDQAYAADPEQRQKVINDQWKTGLITKNQALDELGFNTIGPAGEVYLFSGNFVMTDTNNEVILKAGGNAPGDEDAEKTDDKDKAKAPVLSLVKN